MTSLLGHDRLLKLMRKMPLAILPPEEAITAEAPEIDRRPTAENALIQMLASGSERVAVIESGRRLHSLLVVTLVRSVLLGTPHCTA